jgi:ATP-binding cassette, subfamily B, bacterial PglK
MSKVKEDTSSSSVLRRSFLTLSISDRRKVLMVIALQVFFGFLDLAAVGVIGILGALSIRGIQSQPSGGKVQFILKLLHLQSSSFQSQVGILGILAALLLISRTIFSIFFIRRTLFFLARRSAQLSATLVQSLLGQSLTSMQSRTTQQTLYAVTDGVSIVMLGVLGTAVTLISDGSLLIILSIGLFVVDPIVAASMFIVFGGIALLLYKYLHVRARVLGDKFSSLHIESNEKIVEVMNSYRELVVHNRRNYYANEIANIRYEIAESSAETAFMPNISKYVIESTVVLGSLLISAFQFVLQDAAHAVATLAIFLAAGTRIAPAILRMQQGSLSIRGSVGAASPTLNLIDALELSDANDVEIDPLDIEHDGFEPSVVMEGVSYRYPNAEKYAIDGLSIKVEEGELVAIVGPSGAGKTTLIDLMLGLLEPSTGEVRISNQPPSESTKIWPGACSYVPQDAVIINGTIRENVALGYPTDSATDEIVMQAIKIAALEEMVRGLPDGLDSQVGERGARLSGGQRQRLGIARAMFTNPRLLILDEATSALDGVTELEISNAIANLRGRTTVVIIAHRLSTVRNADVVYYLENGKLIAHGNFERVRELVPNFDHQAKLMGL